MPQIKDEYYVYYKDKDIGVYYIFDNGLKDFNPYSRHKDIDIELKEYGLDQRIVEAEQLEVLDQIIKEENRLRERKKIIYVSGPFRLEREAKLSGESFSVYRRGAEKGEADYSPLAHDAPHYEGEHTPKDMREWASWYAFNKMDDGTYEAELDEAWCWGGGHNEGGTMHRPIPEEWFKLDYDEFLEKVVSLAAAAHYGFTAEMLKKKKGLKKFFGYTKGNA